MNNNSNRRGSGKEKQMNAITKATSVAVLVALGLALAAGAAEPPKQAAIEPKEGELVDFAPWCYTYVKGATDNSPESCWLNPPPNMLGGLMWESSMPVSSLVIKFIPGTGAIPKATELSVICSSSIASHGLPGWWQPVSRPSQGTAPQTPEPAVTLQPDGQHAFAFPAASIMSKEQTREGVRQGAIIYSGADAPARFTMHLYRGAKWRAPMDIEIEWGFPVANQYADVRSGKSDRDPVDGRIEAYQGYVTQLQPLASGGMTLDGPNQWREKAGAAGRRGLRARVWLTDNPAGGYTDRTPYGDRTIVTLWTTAGEVSFAPSDLEAGPILIPSVSVFVAKAGSGTTAAQFQKDLLAGGKKTIRQRVREHRELNWASAMQAFFPGKALPPIPEPPGRLGGKDFYPNAKIPLPPAPTNHLPPGMTIDVPEKELNQQWRLSAAHLQKNTELLKDGTYMVKIWPYPTALALESYQILRAYDLIGLPQFAEGGLNFWLLSAKPVSPKGNLFQRDNYKTPHKEGHARIQATAGFHYLMTRNDEWRKKVLPELEASYEHSRELRANTSESGNAILRSNWRPTQSKNSGSLPPTCWAAGLLPPFTFGGDIGGCRMSYRNDAGFYEGMLEVANLVAIDDPERGGRMRKEAEDYRQAIRRSMDRAVALTPVIKVQDGTYRRYMPYGPYTRGTWPQYLNLLLVHRNMYHDVLCNGLSVCWRRVYAPDETVVQETLDIVEDLFQQPGHSPRAGKIRGAEPWFYLSGFSYQCAYDPTAFVHLLSGDVPLAIRAFYVQYACNIHPDLEYHFAEHPLERCKDKTFEEAAFLERVRMLLVQEEGESLWLARFALREWFEQGKKISVKNAPTFFGPTGYEVISDVDNGKINATVELPARNAPKEVVLRFRHPKSAPIKGVTVNGKPWTEFNKDQETITLKGLTGTVSVTAQY